MKQVFVFTINSTSRLDEFLRQELPEVLFESVVSQSKKNLSNSKIRRLVFSGNIFVNGTPAKNPAFVLQKGARVKIVCDAEKLFYEKPTDDADFVLDEKNIIYEDEYIIVVNKPYNLPTEGSFVKERASLYGAVTEYLDKKNPNGENYCGIVHRLDRGTSGVILFSKSKSVNAALHKAFESCESPAPSTSFGSRKPAGIGVLPSSETLAPSMPNGFATHNGIESPEGIEGRAAKKIYFAICTRDGQDAGGAGEASAFLRLASTSSGSGKPAGIERPATFAAAPSKPNGYTTHNGIDSPQHLEAPASSKPFGEEPHSFSMQNHLARISPKSHAVKFGLVPPEKGGKFARTDFTVLQERGGKILVQAELVTGRTHQIRVHLSQSKMPILGDRLYGGAAAERIFLHAYSLELPHPITGRGMKFFAPLPEDFHIPA